MQQNTQAKRSKILYLITKSNFGGAQRYVYDLATSLPSEQFEVTVAFGGTGIPGSEQGRLATLLHDAHIRTCYVPELGRDISPVKDIASLRALISLLRAERPDVIHLNSSKVGLLGSIAGRITRVPRIIYTAHGWAFWEDRSPLVTYVIKILSWLTVACSHVTICISDFDRENVRWMYGVQQRLRVIRNGVAPFVPLERIAARNTLFSPDVQLAHRDDLWLVSNGELHRNKNYLFALDVLARYNATHDRKIFYTIISSGEMKDAIEQHIAALGIGEHVTLLGFVADARVYLKAFDVLFLPSRKEGVPYVILESGYARVPVVASKVGGIPEIIVDHESGLLIDPTDIPRAVTALETMVDNADMRTAMARNLHDHVMIRYDQKKMVADTLAHYRTPSTER